MQTSLFQTDREGASSLQPVVVAHELEPRVCPREAGSGRSGGTLFRCIVADPPWDYPEGFATQSRSPGRWSGPVKCKPLPYPSMTVAQICALPVAALSAPDCRLWLWTTNRYLPEAFAVMSAWGFEYRQTLTWHKTDGNMGGSVAPNSAEFLLVGVRGNPGCKSKLKTAVVKLPQSKQHSRKPREFHWLIEQVDDGPRLEMFARRQTPGWSVWGNQVASDVELRAGGGGAEQAGDANANEHSGPLRYNDEAEPLNPPHPRSLPK